MPQVSWPAAPGGNEREIFLSLLRHIRQAPPLSIIKKCLKKKTLTFVLDEGPTMIRHSFYCFIISQFLCFYEQKFGWVVFKLLVYHEIRLSEQKSFAYFLGRNQHTTKPDVTENRLQGICFFFLIIISVTVGGHVRTCRLSALFEIELECVLPVYSKSKVLFCMMIFKTALNKPQVLVSPLSSTGQNKPIHTHSLTLHAENKRDCII